VFSASDNKLACSSWLDDNEGKKQAVKKDSNAHTIPECSCQRDAPGTHPALHPYACQLCVIDD
jgi:hypothetical protein